MVSSNVSLKAPSGFSVFVKRLDVDIDVFFYQLVHLNKYVFGIGVLCERVNVTRFCSNEINEMLECLCTS